MQTTHQFIPSFLMRALEERLARNPAYSIRAFARDLDIDHSQLAAVLRGRKGLSQAKAERIALAMGLNSEERSLFLLQVKREHARSAKDRKQAAAHIAEVDSQGDAGIQLLTADRYRMIADWQNTAVLEYLRRPRAIQDPERIAKAFRISVIEVQQILARLARLEMIVKTHGRWKVAQSPFLTGPGVPSEFVRKHHTQILKKADEAIHIQSPDQREFRSTELVIHSHDLPEIKKFLDQTWKSFCKRFARNATGDAVYEFSYQLFELGLIQLNSERQKK